MLERVLRHWPLKLLSLGLALAIWVSVTGESTIVQDFPVPLDIDLPESLILQGQSAPTTVMVRLRGPETQVRRIDPLPLEVALDLRDSAPGTRTVQLSTGDVNGVPQGVEITLIEPDRFELGIERRMRQGFPVSASLIGTPAEGYAFYGTHVTPSNLVVEGPESEVKAMSRLRTDPIQLDGRTSSFRIRVRVVPDSPGVRVLSSNPVEVLVEMDEAPVAVTFPSVAVVLAGQVYEATVRPQTLRVTFTGPPELVRRVRPEQIRAVADVSGLQPMAAPTDVPVRVDFVDVPARDLTRIMVKSLSHSSVSVQVTSTRISS